MPGPTPYAFTNKGLVQKHDPSQLQDGEHYQLENAWSQQEGAITARTGHQQLLQRPVTDPVVSISKLNLGGDDTSNPRYLGSGDGIYREISPYSSNTKVYSGLTSGARWTAQQYNAGTTGTPALLFATRNAALRDNGAYATLQKWGVDPPLIPAIANPAAPTTAFVANPVGTTNRFIPGVNANVSYQKTISAISVISPSGASFGYTKITPTASSPTNGLNGIFIGMIVVIFDPVTSNNDQIVVQNTDGTSFYGWTTHAYPIGNAPYLTSGQTPVTGGPGTLSIYSTGNTINAAFSGVAPTYDSSDIFHIDVYVSDPALVQSISVQIVPNYTGSPPASDYYQYVINPAALNVSNNTATSEQWTELAIPKNKFTAVGNAGTGAYTWANVNQIYVVIAVSGSITAKVGFMYFQGGGGLNDAAAGTSSYDWLYTFRNPTTGAEGNPSVAMVAANYPPNVENGAVTLTLTGTPQAATIANGIGEISRPGSIAVYRRGGTFSDGQYRLVGYAANPGAGATVNFTDNATDLSLASARTVEFDNDPPVLSSLPVALTANILHFQPSGGGSNTATNTANTVSRLILSNLPTNFPYGNPGAANIASAITVGSTMSVGFGLTAETVYVSAVGYDGTNAWLEGYLQNTHHLTSADPSETIEIDAILRGKCDLAYQDFDCVFLAGDANAPATLYQSKVGRPEAFPLVNLENGFAQHINVGSPSNPIFGISSIGPGELVCLNQDNLYIVQVWAGQMQQPIQSPAQRGLYAKWCWCRGDNRIWYLAYDGIYSWSGGESRKVSEQIDYLFKNQMVNGILPIDYSQASKFSFAYAENALFVVYIDTNGDYHRLRYETIYDRWTIDTIYAATTGTAKFTIDDLFTEPDTGWLLVSVTEG